MVNEVNSIGRNTDFANWTIFWLLFTYESVFFSVTTWRLTPTIYFQYPEAQFFWNQAAFIMSSPIFLCKKCLPLKYYRNENYRNSKCFIVLQSLKNQKRRCSNINLETSAFKQDLVDGNYGLYYRLDGDIIMLNAGDLWPRNVPRWSV